MSSIVGTHGGKGKNVKQKKIYYSARGGARSKGADLTARTNASSPPLAALETPLPRDTSSHYLRGGTGNEWHYVVEDGVFERALAYDRYRLEEMKWQESDHRVARTGLRGGACIPKKKDPKSPKASKLKHLTIFRRRAGSLPNADIRGGLSAPTSPSKFSLSSYPTRDFAEKSLEQRLYELSIASSDDAGSIAFSNFTAPTWLLRDGEENSSQQSFTPRARSLSLSSTNTVESLWTPETSPVDSHGRYSVARSGVQVFKPEEAQPLIFDEADEPELALNLSAIAI